MITNINVSTNIKSDIIKRKIEPVNYSNIEITGIPIMTLDELRIESKINEHAKLKLTGLMEEGRGENTIMSTLVGMPIGISLVGISEEGIAFFQGVIMEIRFYKHEGLERFELTALSNTYSMDISKKSGSHQNITNSYSDIMSQTAERNNAMLAYGTDGRLCHSSMGEISIQYKETDWEYIRRLASHKNLGLYPNMASAIPSFVVGASGNKRGDIDAITCHYEKKVRDYEVDLANHLEDICESDYLVYDVSSYRILNIGDMVTCEGRELYIKEAVYEMQDALVVANYRLCTKYGLLQKKMYNERLQGLSVNARVVESVRDKVRLQLDMDTEENSEYEFTYSTIAASPDGSGWYCMPEKGDIVRVYFPDVDEKKCFAISSVYSHEQGADGADRMADPEVTYLRTADNKELRLTPQGITINADDGRSLISLDNEGNITISGAGSISFKANNDVNICAAHNISLFASENIKISGQSGTIEMMSDGNTRLTGEYVVEN